MIYLVIALLVAVLAVAYALSVVMDRVDRLTETCHAASTRLDKRLDGVWDYLGEQDIRLCALGDLVVLNTPTPCACAPKPADDRSKRRAKKGSRKA